MPAKLQLQAAIDVFDESLKHVTIKLVPAIAIS